PPRRGSGEVTFDEVLRLRDRRIRLRGEHLLRPPRPAHSREHHEAGGLVATDTLPLPSQQRMHFPHPVDAVVLLMETADLRHEQLVTQLAGRWHARLRGAIPAGGDEPWHHVPEDAAEELDPELIPMLVDEADHVGQGRSSSFAKNTLAALRTSFAFRSSAFSRRSRLFSSATSVGTPGRCPASISRRRCHTRSVSGLMPSRPATCRTADMRFGCSGLASSSIRSARPRISSEYV